MGKYSMGRILPGLWLKWKNCGGYRVDASYGSCQGHPGKIKGRKKRTESNHGRFGIFFVEINP